MATIKLYPRLIIGFLLFVISGAIFGELLITLHAPNKNLQSGFPSPSVATTATGELEFVHPNGSYSFVFPNNWNVLFLAPDQNVVMVAPQDKIEAVQKMEEGFGTTSDLVMTITQSNTKPKLASDKLWDVTSKESITIDSKNSSKNTIQVLKNMSGFKKDSKLIDIVVPHQNIYLDIQLLDATHEDTFNNILESFKLMTFTESTPSPTPSIQPSQSPQASAAGSPL